MFSFKGENRLIRKPLRRSTKGDKRGVSRQWWTGVGSVGVMALDYSRTPSNQGEQVADRSQGGISDNPASNPRNVGSIQHSQDGPFHQADRAQPSSATASGKPMMHGDQHMSVMDAFNQMKRLLDR